MMRKRSDSWLHLFVLVVILMRCSHCRLNNSPGETQPPRVEIPINGSANITCRMNLTKFGGNVNSSTLHFVEEDTGRQVPDTDIEVRDESTIVFMLRNAREQDRNYVCKSGDKGIGVTRVSVGTAPLDVTDFECRGFDYTYMVCNFSIPHNVIPTQYSLIYTAQSVSYIQTCPLEVQQNQAICNLTLEQNTYRTNYEFFNFTLTGHNDIGRHEQSFWINNYESVIPPRPEYTIENITSNSVILKWSNIKYSFYTTKGLQYEVRLRLKNGPNNWLMHSNYTYGNDHSEYTLHLHSIPFAYIEYEVSLRIRVNGNNDDSYWSEPYIQEFRTAACAPATAPLTDVGSFYIDSTETKVRLYWHQLPHYMQNGPDFEYVVKEVKVGGKVSQLRPEHIDRTSAVFEWRRGQHYEFSIVSRNAEGYSPNESIIVVPAWSNNNENQRVPQWIRKLEHAVNGTYTLTWTPPSIQNDLIDYTIFWCQSKKGTPNECDDTVYFKHVDRNVTRFNTSPQRQEHTLNLAISANYRDFTSGMHWTMCTAYMISDLPQMEPKVLSSSSRSITMQWSSDYVCSYLLTSYAITYCRTQDRLLPSVNATNCIDAPVTATLDTFNKKFDKHEIRDLIPFSTYKIEMRMFSQQGESKMSDAQLGNTTEEAPSRPLHLIATDITSNSAILTWSPPEHYNGNITKYVVRYNTESHVIDYRQILYSSNQLKFQLHNLSSYTSYIVYVEAHTNAGSSNSNRINVTTQVGKPSPPQYIKTKDKSQNILQWSKPKDPSGRLEFYQVSITVLHKGYVERQHLSNVVGSLECLFTLPVCRDADYRYTVKVRAVNVAKIGSEVDSHLLSSRNDTDDDEYVTGFYAGNDDLKCVGTGMNVRDQRAEIARLSDSQKYVQYKSEWETGPGTNCSDTKMSHTTMIALVAIVSSLGVMATFYVVRNKYRKMANISCALPPGLEALAYPTKENGDDGHFGRDKESYYNNENRRLLSSISQDSRYFSHNGDHMNRNACSFDGLTPGSLGKSSGYSGSDDSTHVLADSECVVSDQTLKTDDAYMVMELPKPSDGKIKSSASTDQIEHLLSQSENNGGYVQPSLSAIASISDGGRNSFSNFMRNENGYITGLQGSSAMEMMPAESGYVKPQSIINWPAPKLAQSANAKRVPIVMGDVSLDTSSYVSPQTLQKNLLQPSSNGYTTLSDLGKMHLSHSPLPQLHASPGGTGGANFSELPPISGYVTQKQLSEFGQHQQLN